MSQTRVAMNPMSVGVALIQAMRPHQWIKNLLVFAALLFTAQFTNLTLLWQTVLGFFALCFTASSIYLVNDILDRERDRHHPKKQHRPIASGQLPVSVAWVGAFASLALGLGLAFWLHVPFGVIVLVYVIQSTLYTFYLKQIPLLDVGIIALGFLLRAASGAVLIGVYISPWLIICTFFLALFLGFAKRRHELVSLGEDAASHRNALGDYSANMLEHLLTICMGLTLQSYAIYVILSETAKSHPNLWYTLPVVTYGLLRYFFLVHRYDAGGSPEKMMVSDKHIALSVVVWGLIVLWVMQG